MSELNHPVIGAPITSPVIAEGAVPLRIEIRDLQSKFPDQWNLYLLGLADFQSLDEKSDLSYYGIAGIHGRPYRPWGGVEGNNPGGWQGYCTHSSILFAPWHRPYLALFEQALYASVQNVAGQFPESTKPRYQEAASTFRIPYWDWAASPPVGDSNFPSIVSSATVDVITPQSNGAFVKIANPLYTYDFKPLNPVSGDFDEKPFQIWQKTLRYPSSTSSVNAKSEESKVSDAMQSQFASLQGNVNILMNDPNYQDFAAFSNHAWENNEPGTFASLEDIHNSIHGLVGGNLGHMSELDYSAFDPVFWLHHVNVDRLFAIWQALNPNSYTIDKRDQDGTFVIAGNTEVTNSTSLEPFVDSTGSKYWTSDAVESTLQFNYAYPETQKWKFKNDNDYRNSVNTSVQQLYGDINNQFIQMTAPVSATTLAATTTKATPDTSPSMRSSVTTPGSANGSGQKHNFLQEIVGNIKESFSAHSKGNGQSEGNRGLDLESEIGKSSSSPVPRQATSFMEYIVNLKCPKHLLGQTYRVHIFLGEFGSAANTWHTQNALVGTFVVFGKESETKCGKCQKDAEDNIVVTGTVPLTAALLKEYEQANLGGLGKEIVLPWLRNNLHWRVTLADGTEKDRDEVPGLRVSVVTTEVELAVGGYPRYSGVYEVHPEVTDGRPAGYNSSEQV